METTFGNPELVKGLKRAGLLVQVSLKKKMLLFYPAAASEN